MTISVAIIDDDQAGRRRLVELLNGAPGYRCVSQHRTVEGFLREIPSEPPEVTLLALNPPRANGAEEVRRLKMLRPATQIIILTSCLDSGPILSVLSEGATGCLLKETPPWELLYAVREVHHGGSPMNSRIARKIVESFQKSPPFAAESDGLSPRQARVLDLLAHGHSYQEIARITQLTYATVHTHVRKIYKKLQVTSRHQAVAKYSGQVV